MTIWRNVGRVARYTLISDPFSFRSTHFEVRLGLLLSLLMCLWRFDVWLRFRSGDIHRCDIAAVSRKESSGGTTTCFRHCRVGVLQHASIQGEPMRHHIWGIRCRQNRGCKTHHAIHCRSLRGRRQQYQGDKGYGSGY